MRVYFDARMIDHPGIGRYIKCLLLELSRDNTLNLCLLGNKEKIKKYPDIRAEIIGFDYPIYSVQEQIGFLKLKKIIGNDILHVPHYNVPVLARFNLIATIHDLIHIIYPEGASGKIAPLYMKFMMKRVMKIAEAVICVSQATKDEIAKRLLRPARKTAGLAMTEKSKLHVIYEGVDDVFKKIDDTLFLNQIRKKYNLPDKFILYVGSIRRHKNIGALLDAFGHFRKKNADIGLVMVGRHSQDIDIKRDGVIYLGELESDRELAAIYNLASCLFNLSLYEGFGLTVLEAQRCGLPVICSDIAVHKEIGGNAILPVNSSYIDQIDQNLYNVLFNNDIKDALISKGFENTARFDWATTARQTSELYRKVCSEGSDSSRLAHGNAGRGKDPQCFLQNLP